MAEARVRFIDFILPLVRRRKLILGLTIAVALLAVVAALLWPKTWRASVTLLPPERRMDNPLFIPGGFEGIGAQLRGITLRHVATPTDIFIAILQSRNVREIIVERFGLQEEYRAKSPVRAANILRKKTKIGVTPDGTILVRVLAQSADQAAEMANAYVEELDRVNRTLAFREASAIREFVETELNEGQERLRLSEEELRSFQETHGAIEITEQARAIIAAAAGISAQIMAAEVELGVLRRTLDDAHPKVVETQDLLSELELRLSEIEGSRDATLVQADPRKPPESLGTNGDGEHPEEAAPDVFPPLSRVPALGLEFGRLYRTLKKEETIVTLLTEQFHRARIEERRALPTVKVLDHAVPPERRFRPRRTIMVLAATSVALFVSILLAYALELIDRVRRNPDQYPGLHEASRDLRKGFHS